MSVDYKTKYIDIRAKLLNATDTAYRLGYEQGLKDAQLQQMQQQQMEQMQAEQMAAAQQQGMAPQQEMEQVGGEQQPSMSPEEEQQAQMEQEAMAGEEGQNELDRHIQELQDLVAKGEKPKVTDLRKSIANLVDLRNKQKLNLKKKTAKNISAQKKFVDDIIKKWEDESKSVTEDLEKIIKEQGLVLED